MMIHALPPSAPTAVVQFARPTAPSYDFAAAAVDVLAALSERDTALLHQAQAVAWIFGGEPCSVRPFRPALKDRFVFFRMTLPEGEYVLKLLRAKSEADVAAWDEPAKAEYAWHQGWGVEVRPLPAGMHGLLSRYIDAPTLTPAQIADPFIRRAVLQRLRAIHASAPAPWPQPPPDYSGIARERIRLLRQAKHPEVLCLDDLLTRWKYLHDALAAAQPQLTLCHRDYHPGNIFWHREQIIVIDWDAADYSDPLLDLARFAVLSHISSSHVPALLRDYGLEAPRAEQIRHVELCMAMLNIEFYAHRMKLAPDDIETQQFTAAVIDDGQHISDLPTVSRCAGR